MRLFNPYKRLFDITNDLYTSNGRGLSAVIMLIVLLTVSIFVSVSLVRLLISTAPILFVPILGLAALYLLYRWIRYTFEDPS